MRISGSHTVPGDKSLTHRALFFASLARGESRILGPLASLDSRSTARILRAVGAGVGPLVTRDSRLATPLHIIGKAWQKPNAVLDCGNSGTTARLGLGLMAGRRFSATFTGDASLRKRPMRRVTGFLERMGARVWYGTDGRTDGRTDRNGDGLPVTIAGGKLRSISAELPVSSAQLKSAILLAGVVGGVPVSILEPDGPSRDHTERMLRAFGYDVREGGSADGRIGGAWIHFRPTGTITPFEFQIPGDISSAAFLLGATVLARSGQIQLRDVGVNPTRDGFLHVLARMGALVKRENRREWLGEPVADLVAGPASLRAITVEASEIPSLIDEVPMLAVLASRAEGTSRFHQVGELRVKESDRLGLIAQNLTVLGVDAAVDGDDLVVTGTGRPPRGRVVTRGDHRIAMAFAVLGKVRGARVVVDNMGCADVSFPGFREALRKLVG